MDGFVMVKGEMEEEDETAASAPPQPMAGLHDIGPPPFLMKTFEIVEDSETDAVVSWSSAKNSFIVWDSEKFSTTLLPKYFKHGNFSSFIRQLNTYYGGMEVVGEGEDASSKLYFKWNDDMDACLTTSLIEQMEKGFKVERSFTNVAYSATCHVLEETFGTKFTIENVKHRLKTLKKQLAAFQDMQNSTSGFSFNNVTKMMDAEPTVWDAYLKAHPNVKQYRYKPVPSFENLMIIFGKDRATGQGSETAKERRIRLEREREEVNIDDQDPLISVEKETSTEQYKCSMEMQGDETTTSKFDYKSSTGKTYTKKKSKAEGFKEEFQMLKSGMDAVASAINRCAPHMIITEEQLYEEVQKVDGLSELSQIIAYDFLCGDATRGRAFIGLPLNRKKLWLEFKLGHPLE